jgi:hypothetical protein
VSGIAEIQEAIVHLTPEEQVRLREWLNGLDAKRERRWAAVALERLEAIRVRANRRLKPRRCLRRRGAWRRDEAALQSGRSGRVSRCGTALRGGRRPGPRGSWTPSRPRSPGSFRNQIGSGHLRRGLERHACRISHTALSLWLRRGRRSSLPSSMTDGIRTTGIIASSSSVFQPKVQSHDPGALDRSFVRLNKAWKQRLSAQPRCRLRPAIKSTAPLWGKPRRFARVVLV